MLATPALAGTYSAASVSASTTVAANCNVSTSEINFGTYDPVGINRTDPLTNGAVKITIACVRGSAPVISLGLGANSAGNVRRLKNSASADYLTYELYRPPSTLPDTPCVFPAAAVWGTGANAFAPSAPPSKAPRSFFVCASIPAAQDPTVGTYNDIVNATVNF